MAKTTMNVTMMAHTQLNFEYLMDAVDANPYEEVEDGKFVALTAIRTCYSHLLPSEIIKEDGPKYFGQVALDGQDGFEADRLIRQITRSGHTSTLEHISFTFAVEGVSRSLLAQLTRHRIGFSPSVQSQRYVKLSSDSKHGGFDYIIPKKIEQHGTAKRIYELLLEFIQETYNVLVDLDIPAEDARMILPNAATTNITLTINLRALLDFYGKRRSDKGAQDEVVQLADQIKDLVVDVEPWTKALFERGAA